MLDLLRRLASGVIDIPVTRMVAGSRIRLPLSHELPRYLRDYPDYGLNLATALEVIQRKYPGTPVIDVGANVGDTMAIIRSVSSAPLLCVEANPEYLPALRRNARRFAKTCVVEAALADRTKHERGALVGAGGTARVTGTVNHHIQLETLDSLLARHPVFARSMLVKIDTDGMDGVIMKGAAAYLRQTTPAIFFEYCPSFWRAQGSDPVATLRWLAEENRYRSFSFYLNTGELLTTVMSDQTALLEDFTDVCDRARTLPYFDVLALSDRDADLLPGLRAAGRRRRD